jgi:2,4-dienoyl-CoA reductase-like NADH-dependent reductase (Old Yellow Enzyme family)
MTNIIEKTTLNGMVLKNRMVRSATWEGMCTPEGAPTQKLVDCYQTLAKGGVGLIISGYSFVRPDGKQLPGKLGIHSDDLADEMHNLADKVHLAGGKICIQLVHAGGQTDSSNAGRQPLAPSALKLEQYPEIPAELTLEEIQAIITAFADGARRAKAWGFDAVQLHAAHGYLINQFLSPLSNKRNDIYGGSEENRRRFLLETYAAVRAAAGADYPVLIKLSGDDFLDGGLSSAEAAQAAIELDLLGIDAIEVSGGTSASGKRSPVRGRAKTPADEGFHLPLAAHIKKSVNCPVMVVGGLRNYRQIEESLNSGMADYFSLSRPFIREPDLINRWLQGDHSPAKCQSCNGCFKPGLKEGGIYCVKEKMEQEKEQRSESKHQTKI